MKGKHVTHLWQLILTLIEVKNKQNILNLGTLVFYYFILFWKSFTPKEKRLGRPAGRRKHGMKSYRLLAVDPFCPFQQPAPCSRKNRSSWRRNLRPFAYRENQFDRLLQSQGDHQTQQLRQATDSTWPLKGLSQSALTIRRVHENVRSVE